jgi:hypothetical protein
MVMNESSPPPARERTRWLFFRDVLVLQLKLLVGNAHNFILIPATLAAAFFDLFFRWGGHGALFYRVLEWGRRADEAIGLYSALDTGSEALERTVTVDSLVSQLEQAIVREYEKGGTVASVKSVVERALDRLHRGTSSGL